MSDAQQAAKRRAALEAVTLVESGMVLGLGTGSTASLVVAELGRRRAAGSLRDIIGIPTSRATHEQAEQVGIPIGDLNDHPEIDLTIDGADEVDPSGNLIKGLGGALLREKMVAAASRRLAIVVDPSKLVGKLGTRCPLPVEVVRFGHRSHDATIASMGGTPTLRSGADRQPFVTDEGHWILDVRFPDGIAEPLVVDRALRDHPGVVETGLFLGMHPTVVTGT